MCGYLCEKIPSHVKNTKEVIFLLKKKREREREIVGWGSLLKKEKNVYMCSWLGKYSPIHEHTNDDFFLMKKEEEGIEGRKKIKRER